MITDQDRRILDKFSREIRKRFPDAKIWAFGSRSRGTAEWDSDFDVCVVLDVAEIKAKLTTMTS
jgi:predicted nucleotidyltransferase